MFFFRGEGKQGWHAQIEKSTQFHENRKEKRENTQENVFSYYDEDNSSNENSASRENAGAELDVCTESWFWTEHQVIVATASQPESNWNIDFWDLQNEVYRSDLFESFHFSLWSREAASMQTRIDISSRYFLSVSGEPKLPSDYEVNVEIFSSRRA